MSKYKLQGSERLALPGAKSIGKADPAERLEVSVLLKRMGTEALIGRVEKLNKGDKSNGHMTRKEFAKQFCADPEGIAAVKIFAISYGLAVVQEDATRRTMILSGTVAQFNKAFGVDLQQFEHEDGSYRGRTGPIFLPEKLKDFVDAVLGLDNRPQAKPHFRTRPLCRNVQWRSSSQGATSFYPTQLASLYNFPDGSGQGECIAIIELGGGYRPADLKEYFSEISTASPKVVAISVDHGKNKPTGDQNGPDGEVMLDIEVAGAIAPAANIAVYFAPNTDAGFLDAINSAIHDTTNKPTVISISWGGPESSWTQQTMTAFDQAFQAAVAMGITVCVASGDNGATDGVNDGNNHVDFPASSPNVLACGGTSIQAANGIITSETVWNDGANGGAGGGGVSGFFALPAWQQGLMITNSQGTSTKLQGRGVPDVSADADPETGYDVRVDGNDTVIGGTSAVAPLWAGLIARINSIKGEAVGFVNPQLYKNPGAFNDVSQGNNGGYSATAGWDACSGLGSPNGKNVAEIV